MINKEKKIFISGKIGTWYYSQVSAECKNKFNQAQFKDLFEYKNIFNPLDMARNMEYYFKDNAQKLKSNIEYLNNKAIKECDAIYMLKDYKDSEGAMKELELAKKLNKEIMYQ